MKPNANHPQRPAGRVVVTGAGCVRADRYGTLEVDGQPVDPASMLLQHRGREYPYLDVLKDDFPTDFYWLFGEMLTVVVRNGRGIEQGVHHCRLKLGTRRSYTPTMVSYCEKDITFT